MKHCYLSFFIIALTAFVSCRQSPVTVTESFDERHMVLPEIANQIVTSFCEDTLGQMWIGTYRGVNKYVGRQFYQYLYEDDDSTSIPDNQIRFIFRDSKGRLWIGTSSGICYYTDRDNFHRVEIGWGNKNAIGMIEDSRGRLFINLIPSIFIFNEAEDRFELAIPNANAEQSFVNTIYIGSDDNIWCVGSRHVSGYRTNSYKEIRNYTVPSDIQSSCMDSQKRLWIAAAGKLYLFDTKNMRFLSMPADLASDRSFSGTKLLNLIPYGSQALLFYTDRGFFLYNYADHKVISQTDKSFPFEPPPSFYGMMYVDSQQNLWMGVLKGVEVKYRNKNHFNDNNALKAAFENKSVNGIVQIDNNLWMTTANDGLYVYDMNDNTTTRVTPSFNTLSNNFYTMFVDKDKHLWIGESQKNRIDECEARGKELHLIRSYPVSTVIFKIAQCKDGTILAGGYSSALFIKSPEDKDFTAIPLVDKFSMITSIIPLEDGRAALFLFDSDIILFDPATKRYTTIPFAKFAKHSKIIPNCARKDRDGNIWIGTMSNGLFLLADGKITPVNGNYCSDITSIEQDQEGNIWLSTLCGLSKYDVVTKRFTYYYKENGIGGNQFYDRASCITSSGRIYFGGLHGLTFFNPSELKSRRHIPILFEELKVNNQLILPSNSRCIDKAMVFNPEIHLNYNQRSFSISFAAADYSEYDFVHYYYMIEDYDQYWIPAGNNRAAYYSNLPPGHYTFKVKITNNDEKDVISENAIRIHVAQVPWLRWWAILIYLIACGTAAWFIIRNGKRIRAQKEMIRKTESEKEAEWHTNMMNMQFFSNISHEFRTPLTMIAGPISILCNDSRIVGESKKLLQIVQRSVSRMLMLVNQLMDFQKLENDVIKLQVKREDIISRMNEIIDIFKVNAREKDIELLCEGLEDSFITWFDSDKLEKILGNLLVNALKFTPSGGKITVSFDATEKEVKVSVGDTGPGIPEGKQEDIFKRYYQLENNQACVNWGSGIGLYYAKRLVELHHGSIGVCNKESGGAIFTFTLPASDDAYREEEKIKDDVRKFVAHDDPMRWPEDDEPEQEENEERPTLLVIDDDMEVSNYMRTFLSPYYNVVVKFDALSAYKVLDEVSPDLIICDVLMPEVDGFRFCRMVKQNISYCHIPIILLTAKTLVEDQVKGLNEGANAYVTKPFEPQYLMALIVSLLKNQKNLRNVLENATETSTIDSTFLSDQDSIFMNELYQLMEKELSNSELNIMRITESMHISRTKFYYKMKGLTGKNPNVFFRSYKLNRAAELIREGKYNISEIADMTGFSTLSHFSQSFKKHFGKSPSEYV